MGSEPAAPGVLVVVVATDPGEWFEEALASLGAQDYTNFSVRVVDISHGDGLAERVAAVLPEAEVTRLAPGTSYSAAANHALEHADGTGHVLVCHDDVALAPDALRLLVEEAYRRNAGLTCPKLVRWDAPERLLSVGLGADRLGVTHPLVEPGELDQGQHDAAREVFVSPGAATLVRRDLWMALGGLDTVIDRPGEDLDLSWRAQLAGARVVVAPHAKARHLERPDEMGDRAQRDANRLRTLWTCYSFWSLLLVAPVALAAAMAETLWALAHHRKAAEAFEALGVVGPSLRRPGNLWRSRREAQKARRVGDRALWKSQSKGSARLRGLVLERLERGHQLASWQAEQPGHNGATAQGRSARSDWKVTLGFAFVIVAVLVAGTRDVFSQPFPLVGQMPSTVGGVGSWWRAWWSGPGGAGLGGRPLGLPGAFVLGLSGLVSLWSANVAVHVIVLLPLVVGPLGIYLETKPFASQRGRLAATLVYVAVPVPYDAVAGGHLGALAAYALSPWLIGQLARLSEAEPYGGWFAGASVARLLALGLVVGATASLTPVVLVLVAVVGVSLSAGSFLVGCRPGAARFAGMAAAVLIIALLALLPWSWDLARSWRALVGPPGAPTGTGVSQLLRLQAGPFGGGVLAWAVTVAAAVSLFISRSWRLAWAGRLWVVALTCLALAFVGGRGWVSLPSTGTLLAPAAAALAMAVAVGGASVESDLSGYRFGWRQLAPALGTIAVLAACLPVLSWADSGNWDLPVSAAEASYTFPPAPPSPLGFSRAEPSAGYRVLWTGPLYWLPLAGQGDEGGYAFGTSANGLPAATSSWAVPGGTASRDVAAALGLALRGQTSQLGLLLRSQGVRFVVVPSAGSPGLMNALDHQVDLAVLPSGPGYQAFINSDWVPQAISTTSSGTSGRRVVDVVMLLGWLAGAGIAVVGLRARWRAQLAVVRSAQQPAPASEALEIDWSEAMDAEHIG